MQTTARYPQVANALGFYLTRNDISNFTAPFKAFNLSDPQYAKDLEQVCGVVRAQRPRAGTCLVARVAFERLCSHRKIGVTHVGHGILWRFNAMYTPNCRYARRFTAWALSTPLSAPSTIPTRRAFGLWALVRHLHGA